MAAKEASLKLGVLCLLMVSYKVRFLLEVARARALEGTTALETN